jgi:hypothetical protein
MANNFSIDANCVALFRMESGALVTDSIGTNTLTNVGVSETTATGTFKEGSCAANFESDENDYMYRADADLDAGFPLKSGDTTKKFSCAFWMKQESSSTNHYIIAKYDTNFKRSLAITLYADKINIFIGYNGGASSETHAFDKTLVDGRWYHIGVAHDGVNKTTLVRIYDEYNDTTYEETYDATNETNISDAPFSLGNRGDFDTSYDYDGILDEVVIFKDLLTGYEFDNIRNGSYSDSAMVHSVSNIISEVEYVPVGKVKVSSIAIEVEYEVSSEIIITLGFDAYLQKTTFSTIGLDANLKKVHSSNFKIDALTLVLHDEVTISFDALIKAEGIEVTNGLDAHIMGIDKTATNSIDANLASLKTATNSIDANLASLKTATNSIDAILQKAFEVTTGLHAYILDPYSRIKALDAYLQKQDLTTETGIDAYIQAIKTNTVELDANLVFTTDSSISLDSHLKKAENFVECSMDALLLPVPSSTNSGNMFLIF